MKKPARSLIFLIYFGISLALLTLNPPVSAAFRYLQEGMNVPYFEGEDIITGEVVSLQENLEGNMVVIVFWATWSERSIEELEYLKELASKYTDIPLRIIAVNVEKQNLSPEITDSILKRTNEMALPFPSIIDTGLDIFYSYGVIAVPSTAIIDNEGVLRYGPAGYSLTTRRLINDSIEVLLGHKVVENVPVEKKGYQPKEKASRYYRLAVKLVQEGMYERALRNLEIAESDDDKFAAPRNLRGEIYLKLLKIDSARHYYKTAIELDSNLVAAWTGLGESYLKTDQIDTAFQILSTALIIDSNFTPAMLNLAECLARRGKIDEAIDSLKKARSLNFMDPNIHFCLGRIYLQAGDSTGAVNSFVSALEILYPPD